ncbi:MAG: hypothetical protein QF921_10210 [Pseudomonadales bacterium]|nr:hypothetical protein [Pseudomonadales bacterium]MDP6470579.1 hypothetical protein [Pseudomonadales bacterium]MDP6828566.1 hypothetical protein [Pseudomonadales bacterium]MDP6971868.1 hypothetical protein [Pseudomonadales bacterium]
MRHLRNEYGESGLLGFSLGGNFALRIARATGIPTLAICPAMDAAFTMQRTDDGVPLYRHYFVRKWLRALRAKQAAFPEHHDFTNALKMNSVSCLTDLFVGHYSDFANTDEYFAQGSLDSAPRCM